MYANIQNKAYFTLFINNEIYYLDSLEKYIRHKIVIKKVKPSSIKTILSTLKTYIYWTLANPTSNNDELYLYLSHFLEDQENGFKIFDTVYVEELNEEIEYVIVEVKPKKSSTLDKDKAIIEEYLKATNQELFKSFDLSKNINAYKHQKKYSKGDGYGLKMGKLAQSVFLNDISIIPNQHSHIEGDIKVFPYQLFDKLLEISEPREKLLYLLAGACSARISQALNLTLYDIDYDNKQVWLIDPRTNDQLGRHGKGRKDFLQQGYNIDAIHDYPHCDIGFKAPIPCSYRSRHHLFWFSNKYRELFFNYLGVIKTVPESQREPPHPFFFTTSSGKRLTPQQVGVTFKSQCKKLAKSFPKYSIRLSGLGLHSLRHMFGSVMATIEAEMIMNKTTSNMPTQQIKIITKEAMGHRNIMSTNVYFNRPWSIDKELGEFLLNQFDSIMNTKSQQEMEERYGTKRLKKRK